MRLSWPRPSLLARVTCPCALLALVGLAVLAAAPADAPPAAPSAAKAEALALDHRIIDEAKKAPEIMANLTHLSDVIGPRLTGSPALKKANEWAAEKMKSYGLTDVHLEAWSIPVGWERGTATARLLEPDNGRSLILASMGWAPGTKGRVEGDVVVIKARNATELAQYKGKLKNAIVLRGEPARVRPITDTSMPIPGDRGGPGGRRGGPGAAPGKAPGGARGDGAPRRGDFQQMQALRREMMELMRTEGVAAVLQDAGKPHGLLTTTGGWRGNDRASAGDPVPALFVAHEHYALLHRLASRPAPAKTRLAIEVTNKFVPGPIAVYNTVGEIRGSEKPDEFVVLGAHLDSWDLGQGTTDNGTGSSVVLEAARVLARCGVKPKRTIRFVLFTGEEQGLHGSREYVKKHEAEMPRTSMALVHDTGTGKVIGLGLQGREVLKPVFDGLSESLTPLGFKEINLRPLMGTDHQSFERVGVPGFACRQDMSEYRFTHHSQSDTLDKAHEADLVQGAQVMAVLAMRVANLPELLPRDKPATARDRPGRGKAGEKKDGEKKATEKKAVEKK
jgi:hypothetical protein